MILEQLVTAGTITEFEIWKLRRRYAKCIPCEDPELGLLPAGLLKIGYFSAKNQSAGEPVKSHFKCVIVNEEITVLGSGNMDRASWYTSQELGVAFVSKEVAKGTSNSCLSILNVTLLTTYRYSYLHRPGIRGKGGVYLLKAGLRL